MRELSDSTLDHLRRVIDVPDFAGTRYRVRSFIASGGMGDVYVAEDMHLDREVAIKVLGPSGDADAAARMQREALVIARLEHPSIVPVHDVGTLPDGRVFYVMKRVIGDRLDQHVTLATPLGERLAMFRRVCEAVAYAHANGVVHRDLKPANIMVGSFGEVLVMDWGLAKVVRSTGAAGSVDPDAATIARPAAVTLEPPGDLQKEPEPAPSANTVHGTVLGTPGYMAPEQVEGDVARVDARTDVYALGAILAFVASGARPLEGRDPRRGDIPKRLAAIVARAMAQRPEDRYASALALAEDVRAFSAGEVVDAYPESPMDRALRLATRYRVPIALVLAYILARVAVFFFSRR